MGTVVRLRRFRVDGKLFQLEPDRRDTPLYSVQRAAAYLGIARGTLRHWLKATGTTRAIIEADPDSGLLSFYNLIEAHILRVAIERRVTLQKLRLAVERLREKHPNERHPLLIDARYTAGNSLFAKTIAGDIENLSAGGQLAFRSLYRRHLQRIDWDDSGPFQVRPFKFTRIAINYRVSGGQPVVVNTGVMADVIAMRLRGGESARDIASDYEISVEDVRQAQRYAAA